MDILQLQITFSNVISWMKIITIWFKFHRFFFPVGQVDNMGALIQVMAWHWLANKSLSEPVMSRSLRPYGVISQQWVNSLAHEIYGRVNFNLQTPFTDWMNTSCKMGDCHKIHGLFNNNLGYGVVLWLVSSIKPNVIFPSVDPDLSPYCQASLSHVLRVGFQTVWNLFMTRRVINCHKLCLKPVYTASLRQFQTV